MVYKVERGSKGSRTWDPCIVARNHPTTSTECYLYTRSCARKGYGVIGAHFAKITLNFEFLAAFGGHSWALGNSWTGRNDPQSLHFDPFFYLWLLQGSSKTPNFNPSSPKGGCKNPLTVFALVLKIAQPRGKIVPGTFKFILFLHFSQKIPNLPPTPGGRVIKVGRSGGLVRSRDFWIGLFWKYLKWYALQTLFAS